MNAARTLHLSSPEGSMRPDDAPQDPELFAALAKGDLSALGALYDRYHAVVLRFASRAVGPADADDLAQEVFLSLTHIAKTYDGRPCAKPFLIGITVQLLRRKRQLLGRASKALSAFGQTMAKSLARTPEDDAEDEQRWSTFERALLRLSEDKRLVFLMVEAEGMQGSDVAAALDIPVATVWTRLHYARAELQKALTKGRRP